MLITYVVRPLSVTSDQSTALMKQVCLDLLKDIYYSHLKLVVG